MNVYPKVTDRNDHTATFLRQIYHLAADENSPPGLSIGRVTATDRDIGPNGNVEYWIEDGVASRMFGVDRETGILTTRVALDREQAPSVEFNVTASDQGEPARSSHVRVQVSMTT